MTIRVRGTSFQVDFVHGGKRYRKDKPTMQEAKDCEITAKANLIKGLDPFPDEATKVEEKKGKTFGESSEEVWNLEWSKGKSAKKTRSRLNLVQMDIGRDTLLTDITTDRLDQYTIEFTVIDRCGELGF